MRMQSPRRSNNSGAAGLHGFRRAIPGLGSAKKRNPDIAAKLELVSFASHGSGVGLSIFRIIKRAASCPAGALKLKIRTNLQPAEGTPAQCWVRVVGVDAGRSAAADPDQVRANPGTALINVNGGPGRIRPVPKKAVRLPPCCGEQHHEAYANPGAIHHCVWDAI